MAETRFARIADDVRDLLRAERYEGLGDLVGQYQPTEIAEDLEVFSPDEQFALLRQLPTTQAVDILECLDEPLQIELLKRFHQQRQAAFLRAMEPDDRADLFQALPEHLAAKFLAMLPREEKEKVRELVSYGPTTAGGLMTTDFASVSPEMTVAQAIQRFRLNYADLEMVYYIYVLDGDSRLVGVVSIRQMLLREPDERIEAIMFRNVISVRPDTDQEEVAQILTLYDFYALPVVEESKHMLGIVTFDDIADVMSDEATEDLERFGAVLPSEQSYGKTSVWAHVRRRVPWLFALLVLSSISGFVISHAQGRYFTGDESGFVLFGLLVALYPMLTATAGNAGTQVATLMIRGVATGEISAKDRWQVLWKELLISLAMGAVLAVLAFARSMMGADQAHWLFLGCSVGAALVAMLIIANLTGALLPLLSERLGIDPALMSGPLIATIIDILSAVVYFAIAALVVMKIFPLG
ncbi:hypothetical protein AMJ85_04315 [candidate division BRC1 bacterium SM23_51]|nr:MAG: hypothetical protein AMJ85_04315 [candidate division BRC1 bacterium SM23_51]